MVGLNFNCNPSTWFSGSKRHHVDDAKFKKPAETEHLEAGAVRRLVRRFRSAISSSPRTTRHSDKTESKLFAATSKNYAAYLLRSTIHANHGLVEQVETLKPITSASRILDVGCGTGALAISLQQTHPSTPMAATDISAEMLRLLDQRIKDEGWKHVRTRAVDAHELSDAFMTSNGNEQPRQETFSHVFTTFMLQFVADPIACLREMYTVTEPDGVFGSTIWTYLSMRDIVARLHERYLPGVPVASVFTNPKSWTTLPELEAGVKQVGFVDISAVELPVPFWFQSAEEFCDVFFNGKNPTSEALIASWPNGVVEDLKRAMVDVIKTDFDNGKSIGAKAAFVVGRRPQ